MKIPEDDILSIANLKQHGGWQALIRMYEQFEREQFESLARLLLKGTDVPQADIDEKRAYFRAMRDILQAPETALIKLKKFVETSNQ